MNVILIKFLYRKCLLFGVYKYLKYNLYFAGQLVPLYFAKFQKKSLGLLEICIETYRSVTQKEMFCLNL